ncbi:10814_t:CDS:1, partial [Acaulospora colombiana]
LYGFSPHSSSLACSTPDHFSLAQPISSPLLSVATNTPPIVSNTIPPAVTTSPQRAKFPCNSCGKKYISRLRAYSCLLKHAGSKPFP